METTNISCCAVSDHQNELAYRIDTAGITFLSPSQKKGLNKPDLIAKPNSYRIFDTCYDCMKPGLYRIVKPFRGSYQFIVPDSSPLTTAGFFSLLFIRGNQDDQKKATEMSEISLTRFLVCTCGYSAIFIKEMLEKLEFKARLVRTFSLLNPNSYNDGHVMLEIFRTEDQSWVLFDSDKKCFFLDEYGQHLNLYDFCLKLNRNEKYSFLQFGNGCRVDFTGFADSTTGFNFQFIEAALNYDNEALKSLYSRICMLPVIDNTDTASHGNNGYSTYWNDSGKDFAKKHNFCFMSNSDFLTKFYNV